jgi:hypothetical protein
MQLKEGASASDYVLRCATIRIEHRICDRGKAIHLPLGRMLAHHTIRGFGSFLPSTQFMSVPKHRRGRSNVYVYNARPVRCAKSIDLACDAHRIDHYDLVTLQPVAALKFFRQRVEDPLSAVPFVQRGTSALHVDPILWRPW